MKYRRYRHEGEFIPFGWGEAYYDHMSRRSVLYPIPFNILVGWSINIFWFLTWKATPKWFENKVHEILDERMEYLKNKTKNWPR